MFVPSETHELTAGPSLQLIHDALNAAMLLQNTVDDIDHLGPDHALDQSIQQSHRRLLHVSGRYSLNSGFGKMFAEIAGEEKR
jgi:hypothetical protein